MSLLIFVGREGGYIWGARALGVCVFARVRHYGAWSSVREEWAAVYMHNDKPVRSPVSSCTQCPPSADYCRCQTCNTPTCPTTTDSVITNCRPLSNTQTDSPMQGHFSFPCLGSHRHHQQKWDVSCQTSADRYSCVNRAKGNARGGARHVKVHFLPVRAKNSFTYLLAHNLDSYYHIPGRCSSRRAGNVRQVVTSFDRIDQRANNRLQGHERATPPSGGGHDTAAKCARHRWHLFSRWTCGSRTGDNTDWQPQHSRFAHFLGAKSRNTRKVVQNNLVEW